MMIHWKWVFPFPGCYADIVTVPEGYGIPLVALDAAGGRMLSHLIQARPNQLL